MGDIYANNRKLYTYDDYREEIASIMKRNGRRIKLVKILEECGISVGNYYSFKNNKRNALSYKKLDALLAALRKEDRFPEMAMASHGQIRQDENPYREIDILKETIQKQQEEIEELKKIIMQKKDAETGQ